MGVPSAARRLKRSLKKTDRLAHQSIPSRYFPNSGLSRMQVFQALTVLARSRVSAASGGCKALQLGAGMENENSDANLGCGQSRRQVSNQLQQCFRDQELNT
jgi:hypothetical protein